MNKVAKNMKNKVMRVKAEMSTALVQKDHGGKEIIVELGLAAIAVALLLVYRTEINTLVTGIMADATTAIGGLFTI